MIYVIGDSHTWIFKSDSRFKVTDVYESKTAYQFLNEHKEILTTVLNSMDKENDKLILVFGEVDCRYHVYYQSQKTSKSISTVIDETVVEYGKTMQFLIDSKIKFYICGIAPPTDWLERYDLTRIASLESQSKIVYEFNLKLKEFCKTKGYSYLDIYSKTVGNNGFIKKEYLRDDGVHLADNALPFVLEMLELR